MDLKVIPSSDRGYNYLLVMRCNNSCYIITEALKTRQAKGVVNDIFQNLICAHGINIKIIYWDAHEVNPAERLLLNMAKNGVISLIRADCV